MAASAYADFLRSPSTGALAADASINYITTTTQITEPTAILKHINALSRQVEKLQEKVLNTIESADGLCLETETTLKFITGGGVYLPGVDDNLLDDRTVTFPLTHIVRFDASHKIQQIRLYWDQGTLLKQVEAIGKSGRNWPIRDGQAQVAAIRKSLYATGQTNGSQSLPRGGTHDVVINQHKRNESTNVTRDPNASLSLFAPRDPNEDSGPGTFDGPKVAPRESAKPKPRDMGELFVDDESAAQVRSASPTKSDGVNLKGGAGRFHITNRLFDENEDPVPSHSPERKKKTYSQKHEHFEFGDGEDAPAPRPISGKNRQHQSHFSFEDFSTPPKAGDKGRPDFEKHWGAGVDPDDPPSPLKRPIVHAARPDAEPHFKLGGNSPLPVPKPKSHQRQQGMGLYADFMHDDEPTPAPSQAYKTAGDGMGGRKATNPSDNSFGPTGTGSNNSNQSLDQPRAINASRRVDDFASHYSMTDAGPNVQEADRKIYKTAGDGMGGRKGNGRHWGFGDDEDYQHEADVSTSRGRRNAPKQSQAGAQF